MSAAEFVLPAPPARRRRGRRVAFAVLGFVLALSLGALAAWVLIPQGTGSGYGKGADATNGLALTTLTIGQGNLTGVGPGQLNAPVQAQVSNSNAFPVTLTKIQQNGGLVTAVDNPSCTAPAGSFTLDTFNGSQAIAAGGTTNVALTADTTNAFPVCFANGVVFAIPITLDGTA
jgi:hypothetical protein